MNFEDIEEKNYARGNSIWSMRVLTKSDMIFWEFEKHICLRILSIWHYNKIEHLTQVILFPFPFKFTFHFPSRKRSQDPSLKFEVFCGQPNQVGSILIENKLLDRWTDDIFRSVDYSLTFAWIRTRFLRCLFIETFLRIRAPFSNSSRQSSCLSRITIGKQSFCCVCVGLRGFCNDSEFTSFGSDKVKWSVDDLFFAGEDIEKKFCRINTVSRLWFAAKFWRT